MNSKLTMELQSRGGMVLELKLPSDKDLFGALYEIGKLSQLMDAETMADTLVRTCKMIEGNHGNCNENQAR